jgi:hypothetical protein
MKPTPQQITACIATMREMIPFFPATERAELFISIEIAKMVSTTDQLEWLTETACRSIAKWEGLPQLCGLFGSRFPRADGAESPACTVHGHTAEDYERDFFEREAAETDRKIAKYKAEAKKLIGGDVAPFELPAEVPVKRVPPRVDDARVRQRLADTIHSSATESTPIKIPGTPKRTPEESAELLRKIEEDLAARKKA